MNENEKFEKSLAICLFLGGKIAKRTIDGIITDGVQFADTFITNKDLSLESMSFDFLMSAVLRIKKFGESVSDEPNFHFTMSFDKICFHDLVKLCSIERSVNVIDIQNYMINYRIALFDVVYLTIQRLATMYR